MHSYSSKPLYITNNSFVKIRDSYVVLVHELRLAILVLLFKTVCSQTMNQNVASQLRLSIAIVINNVCKILALFVHFMINCYLLHTLIFFLKPDISIINSIICDGSVTSTLYLANYFES